MAVTLSYNVSNQYESDVMRIYLRIDVGASGAVSAAYGGGVASVVKESTAGQYTITLGDRFRRVLFVNAINCDDAVSAWASCSILETPAGLQTGIRADSAFVIQLQDYAASAVDATSGSAIMLEIVVATGNSPYDTYDLT